VFSFGAEAAAAEQRLPGASLVLNFAAELAL
jgi:hypothetical protein